MVRSLRSVLSFPFYFGKILFSGKKARKRFWIKLRFRVKRLPSRIHFVTHRFLSGRVNRNFITTALFLAVLFIPLSSSINLVGQLGFMQKKLSIETLEGGIILDIKVTDGQFVKKGDLLAQLDEPRVASALASQLNAAAAKACKLERYRSVVELTDFIVPESYELIPASYIERYCPQEQKVAVGYLALYRARVDSVQTQLEQVNADLRKLSQGLGNEIRKVQIQEEIYKKKKDLVDLNFYSQAALLEQESLVLMARQALIEKEIEISDRKTRKTDYQRQMMEVKSEFADKNRAEYSALMADFEAQYADLKYAYRSNQNLSIFAPQSGHVANLKKIRPGIILAPRESLMEIVPIGEDLVAIASYAPTNHANVYVGQSAVVRLQTHNQTMSPEFRGSVIAITPDVRQDSYNSPPAYEVSVAFPCELECRKKHALTAGIPVDIYVLGPKRSLFSYLINSIYRSEKAVLSEPN